jgi:hypothetical protein
MPKALFNLDALSINAQKEESNPPRAKEKIESNPTEILLRRAIEHQKSIKTFSIKGHYMKLIGKESRRKPRYKKE